VDIGWPLEEVEDSECSLLSAVDIGHFELDHCCKQEKRLVGRPGAEDKVVAVGGCTAVGSAAGGMVAAGPDIADCAVRVRETALGFVSRRLLPYTKLSHT
jgi:hypothetical protein